MLVGFALGNVPSLITGDWKFGRTWVSLWLSVTLSAVALVAAVFAWVAVCRRNRMIRQNGTAYIIQEFARYWTKDDAARFQAGISRQFARVVRVPGPVEVRRDWDWSLDEDAQDWDARTDELVRAFQVLNVDESRSGDTCPNGVFIWAYWAVATAFGMRVTAGDREPAVLDVWQRPSNARLGEVRPEIWAQRPHRFVAAATSGLEFSEHTWRVTLENTAVSQGHDQARHRATGQLSVLLIRFSTEQWGPLPPVTREPDGPLKLRLRTAVYLPASKPIWNWRPHTASEAEIYELRCVPPTASSGERKFPWNQFPALAERAAAWVEGKAKELDGHTLLIGTAMPQEVSLGLGIHAGNIARRTTWPTRLWPIIFDSGKRDLAVPNLQLGSVAIHPALSESGDR